MDEQDKRNGGAEKVSEKTRLARDADRHNHDLAAPRERAERQASAERKGN